MKLRDYMSINILFEIQKFIAINKLKLKITLFINIIFLFVAPGNKIGESTIYFLLFNN